MESLKFTIPEIMSLFGVVQCVYILVYMALRAGRLSRAGLAIAYFSFLGIAFFLDFAYASWHGVTAYYDFLQWFFWFSGPPLGALLVIQIAQITRTPAIRYYSVLLLIPAAAIVSMLFAKASGECEALINCMVFKDWLHVTGLMAGGLSLLAIWLKRGIFADLASQKIGKERYWLILALIFANIAFLLAMLAVFSTHFSAQEISLVRTMLGLALAYLVTTSLFRIYPQAVNIAPARDESLSESEKVLAQKVEQLINMDKVYHEAAYSRSDLARELGEAETTVSRIINVHFKKSFPQLLNERRIEDAKRLLVQTQANVKTISEEVGFNSLASFNRVFKELTGEAPSTYRKNNKP